MVIREHRENVDEKVGPARMSHFSIVSMHNLKASEDNMKASKVLEGAEEFMSDCNLCGRTWYLPEHHFWYVRIATTP